MVLGLATGLIGDDFLRQKNLLRHFPPPIGSRIIGAVCLIELSVLALSWARLTAFWRRYRRTYTLVRPPLIYADILTLFLTGLLLVIIVPRLSYLLTHRSVLLNLLLLPLYASVLVTLLWSRRQEKSVLRVRSSVGPTGPDHDDRPISDSNDDLLNRGSFVEDLYRQITSLPITASFVIALQGKWGEGKTSVLNLLRNTLQTTPSVIVLDFNPWFSSNETAINATFYKSLEGVVQERYVFSGLHRAMTRYKRVVALGLDRLHLSALQMPQAEPEVLRQELEDWISRTACRVVALVDDVDRLGPTELLAVLKLVGLSSRLSNLITILSLDPTVVTGVLRDRLSLDPAFLEKVIQKSIALPPPAPNEVDRFLLWSEPGHRSSIDQLLDSLKITEARRKEFDDKFSYFYRSHLQRMFPTLRHAKRYLNGLRAGLPSIVNEVHLFDFFLLEVIRISAPTLYEDMRVTPWYYVPAWTIDSSLLWPYRAGLDQKEKYEEIRKHIDTLLAKEPQKDLLLEILNELCFVEVKNAYSKSSPTTYSGSDEQIRGKKRLTHIECFPRYFQFQVPSGGLPDSQVETILEEWNSFEETEAETLVERRLREFAAGGVRREFLDRVMLFRGQIMPHRIRAIVRALYRLAPDLSREGELWSSEHDGATNLTLRLINDKSEDEDIAPLMTELISKTPSLYFMAVCVLSCQRSANASLSRIAAHIAPEQLRRAAGHRLTAELVDERQNIFTVLPPKDIGLVLYQWGTDWMTGTKYYKDQLWRYVSSLLDEDPLRTGQLLTIFRTTRNGRLTTLNFQELGDVFDIKELARRVDRVDASILSLDDAESVTLFRQALAVAPGESDSGQGGASKADSSGPSSPLPDNNAEP